MANVNEVGAATAVATEMTNDDVVTTKIVIIAAIAAMATDTMTVGMRIVTAIREDRALSQMIVRHLSLPLGAQVPHTMTIPDDILPHHRHLKMTDLDGQAHHLRMSPLGISRKTCIEGTVGWTEGATISNGKYLYVFACQNPSSFFLSAADNSVSIIPSVSGRRPLVLLHGNCTYSLFSSSALYSICSL